MKIWRELVDGWNARTVKERKSMLERHDLIVVIGHPQWPVAVSIMKGGRYDNFESLKVLRQLFVWDVQYE